MISDGDDERYETACRRLAARPVVQHKVKHEQSMAQRGGDPRGAPSVTEFSMYLPYPQAELVCEFAQTGTSFLHCLWPEEYRTRIKADMSGP